MKRGKRNTKRNLLMSWTLTLVMLLNVFSPLGTVYAAEVKNNLTGLTLTVKQNGAAVDQDTPLNSTDPINVLIDFRAPVAGDDPTPANPVQHGDTATFKIGSGLLLTSPTGREELTHNGTLVGHVEFKSDPDGPAGSLIAVVDFDGNEEIFDEDGGYNTVMCHIDATFTYDSSGDNGAAGEHVIKILEQEYKVSVPPAEIQYQVTKSGIPHLADKQIAWTVTVSATQGGTDLDLGGYQFFDDLSQVGDYVPGSFEVKDVSPAPTPTWDPSAKTLSYTFPHETLSSQEITFKTTIPNDNYYASSEQTIPNTAQLLDDKEISVADKKGEVKFTPQWIVKEGKSSDKDSGSTGIYNPENRTVTWTITANQMGASLDNVVITDTLPAGLTLQSAVWQTWNGSEWSTPAAPITPTGTNGDEYHITHINSPILLTIVTEVPEEAYTAGITTYENSASIRWDGLEGPGIGTGGVEVGVGYNAITKDGTADPAAGRVHWTVTVDTRKQAIPDLAVYDLLVYGSSISGFSLANATDFPSGLTKTGLTPRYDQKYVDGTFSGSTGLGIVVHPITQDGVQVADLLEITGISTSEANTFTFDSLVVNPNVFAGNKTSVVWNTASLFSANAKLNAASKDVSYGNRMLAKELLKREAIDDPATGVNDARTDTLADGFDYTSKSVVFRLSVNADGIPFSARVDAAGNPMGAAIVTDTLPEGWEYMDFDSGSKYLIFAGTGDTDGTVTATGGPLASVAELGTPTFDGRTATFTFDPLTQPYVILVKARPTDDTAAGYFASNQTVTPRNVLNLSTESWTTGVTTHQDVSITSKLLEKSWSSSVHGEVLWTIDYKPYDLALTQPATKLEDQIPVGIDLRTDASGALLLAGNITAHKMTLKADGSYDMGDEVVLIVGQNVSYDRETRILTFQIADSTQAYRFTYLTDTTGEASSTPIKNRVSLYAGDNSQVDTDKPYQITAADVSATLQRNGLIIITKIDGAGDPLPGVEFTLFASDNTTPIRTGVTGENGVLRFKVIPDGDYILRETKGADGYVPDGRAHTLSVRTTGSTVVSSIDGKTGDGANAITVQNFAEGTVGSLTVRKMVAGNAADSAKAFDLTVSFPTATGTYSYVGSGVPDGTIRSGDTISLAHGQSITIRGLPKDTAYTVSEADYSSAGYSKISTGETGTIEPGVANTATATFTNTRNVSDSGTGTLTIGKSVAGPGADTTKAFAFTVTFQGASGTYRYTGIGVPGGTIRSGDTISLAHGQSITITGLPLGATYQVSENSDSAKGYSSDSAGASGTVSSRNSTAAFTNTKLPEPTGSLTIRKTVSGQGADQTKPFAFTVTLVGAPDAYAYTGSFAGTLRSGDVISLTHGQSITITGLPLGTQYTVTEADYSADGYSASASGAAGTLSDSTPQTASFTNTRGGRPGNPGDPSDPSSSIDDGSVPTGSMDGGNNGSSTPGGTGGMPKTGDSQIGTIARLGLFFFSAAFAVLFTVDAALGRQTSGKRIRK